jgi:hypothetical protein
MFYTRSMFHFIFHFKSLANLFRDNYHYGCKQKFPPKKTLSYIGIKIWAFVGLAYQKARILC